MLKWNHIRQDTSILTVMVTNVYAGSPWDETQAAPAAYSFCFLHVHPTKGAGTSKTASCFVLCREDRCFCTVLWVFVFTCELYQPGRETSSVALENGAMDSAEASGFILEQVIRVRGIDRSKRSKTICHRGGNALVRL